MKVYSLADITCDGAAHALSATSQPCKWYRVTGTTIASAAARVGDSNVSTTRGSAVTTSVPFQSPVGSPSDTYDLADVFQIGTNNDKLNVIYGV